MKNYLIIDDNEYDRHFLSECLKLVNENCQVQESDNIESGCELMAQCNPDAVFLDFSLTGSTAFNYFDLLESQQKQAPRTIIMSGVDMGKNVTKLIERGAVDYLLKDSISPQNLEILLSKTEVNFKKLSNLDFFENVVQNYSDLTVLCDNDEKILYLNKEAQNVFPKNIEQQPISKYLTKGNSKHWLIEGHENPFQMIKSNINIKGEDFVCIVLKNSSQLASLEQSLNQSDKFSKALAHDLRDQLSACDAIAQLINADPKSSDIHESLDMLDKSLSAAVQIIDSLSIITGNNKTNIESYIDLNEIVKTIKSDLHIDMPEILTDISCGKVYGSSKLFITVFQNMLSNSYKHFSGEGHSKVIISANEDGDKVIVNYRDNGPGIPESIINSLCKFGVKSSSSAGMGLGMYLVKSALDIMGGSLEVRECSQGAHFRIELRKV